jgi:DNA-binding transcriptional MerR regulator
MDITVGALAARTGITVRTLHHYDAIGLLSPSGRTQSGYRLYSEDDIRRLESIVLLRGVGLPLGDIVQTLSSTPQDLRRTLETHSVEMRRRADDFQTLAHRLDHMIERLRTHTVHSIDEALAMIRVVQLFEQYFDRSQLDDIRERARELGEQAIHDAEAEWPRLIAAVRHEMNSGTDPDAPEIRPLVRRWQELVQAFTNGRFDIAAGAGRMLHAEPSVRQRMDLDSEVMEYVARATAALRRHSTSQTPGVKRAPDQVEIKTRIGPG